MIDVVAGVIVVNHRLLLTQRPGGKDFAFTWECPGGKVESTDKHHAAALSRELYEEIGIDAKIAHLTRGAATIWDGVLDLRVPRPNREQVHIFFYFVGAYVGVPQPREGQGLGWFTVDEMRRLTLAPANVEAYDAIAAFAEGHNDG